jgi:hypothetical protein
MESYRTDILRRVCSQNGDNCTQNGVVCCEANKYNTKIIKQLMMRVAEYYLLARILLETFSIDFCRLWLVYTTRKSF